MAKGWISGFHMHVFIRNPIHVYRRDG